MIFQVVSIFDRKMGSYSGLYLVRTLQEAVRSYTDSMRKDTVVQEHPEDFRLDKVGDFYPETGELVPCAPSLVCEAAAVLRPVPVPSNAENN